MKYKRNKIIIPVLGLFSVLICWSCDGYFDQFKMDRLSTEVEIDPALAVPIAYGSFSIQDIFELLSDSAGLVSLTDDSLILISYSNSAYSFTADKLITIPDQTGSETYFKSEIDIPDWAILPEGQTFTFYKTESVEFGVGENDKIDSILLKAGNLKLDVFSQFRHPGTLRMTSSNLVDPSGDSLDLMIEISQADGNFSETYNYDLTGYNLILEQVNDTSVLNIHFQLTLEKTAAGIADGEKAGVQMSFEGSEYRAVYGIIGERAITDLSQKIDLGFFDLLDQVPDIYFADPQINLFVNNSFGVPLTMTLDTFKARSSIDGSIMDLVFKDITLNPFTVVAPSIDQIGQSVLSELSYNVESTNIDQFISSVPDQIDFSFSASTGNPPGSTEQNFILDTSKVDLTAEVLLPLWLSTSGYKLKDTLDVDLENILQQLNMIQSLEFKLSTINEWPLGISIQLYFLDGSNTIIDSLFSEEVELLASSPVDSEGNLDPAALEENVFDIKIAEADLPNLEGAKGLMLVANAQTSDNGNTAVKFYTKYQLQYRLSIAAEFKVNSRELNF